MSTVLTRYSDLADHFGNVVDTLPADAWDAPSSCEGWSGRDVLRHVVGSQRDFLARQGLELDVPPRGDIDADLDADLETDPVAAWHVHDEAMRRLLADESVVAREYDGMLGRTTIGATMVAFYGFDLAVHGWDLARATGQDYRPDQATTSAVLAFTAESATPESAEERAGIFGPVVEVPADAPAWHRALGSAGRDPGWLP